MDAVQQGRGGEGFLEELEYDETAIDMAAKVLLVGGDPIYAINIKDQTEFTILEVIVDRASEFQEVRDKNLATDIANKTAKATRPR